MRNEHCVRLRLGLQSSGEIWRFPYCLVFLVTPTRPCSDNYCPCINTDSYLQSVILASKSSNFVDHAKTGLHCTAGIVLICDRIPEVHKDPITQKLGNIATEAFDYATATLLIGKYKLTQIFRVFLLG
jgi:hypothetical protein